VGTAAGVRWFKANAAACAYEAALAEALGGWLPEAVLVPLAVDAGRGWLLTADAGPTLREALGEAPAERRVAVWAEMLRDYAVLQRAVACRAGELVALGVPDLRPSLMPGHLDTLLADPQVAAELGQSRAAAIGALVPAYRMWCEELASDGIPPSVQHDDLTDSNVFPGNRFFDWGDASVAHPFSSLLVALSFAGHVLGAGPGAPELERLRDAYLEPWTDLAAPPDLRRSVTLACRVARVSRALAWQRALRDAPAPIDDDFRTAVPEGGWPSYPSPTRSDAGSGPRFYRQGVVEDVLGVPAGLCLLQAWVVVLVVQGRPGDA
jgi:hypothetical protein